MPTASAERRLNLGWIQILMRGAQSTYFPDPVDMLLSGPVSAANQTISIDQISAPPSASFMPVSMEGVVQNRGQAPADSLALFNPLFNQFSAGGSRIASSPTSCLLRAAALMDTHIDRPVGRYLLCGTMLQIMSQQKVVSVCTLTIRRRRALVAYLMSTCGCQLQAAPRLASFCQSPPGQASSCKYQTPGYLCSSSSSSWRLPVHCPGSRPAQEAAQQALRGRALGKPPLSALTLEESGPM